MATTTGKTLCVTCGKDKIAYKCEGCSQTFCVNHLADDHRALGLQLDQVENKRNLFRQTLTEQTNNPQNHTLIQQVNQWEKDSINRVRQAAEDARQLVTKHATENIAGIEAKLAELTEQLKATRQENDFNELHLEQFKQELKQLEEQLNRPSNISLRQDSSSFIGRIPVVISSVQLLFPNINANAKWMQNGIIVAGGNGHGNGLNQFHCPWSMYVDDDQTLYVADQSNHRIVEWKSGATSGRVVAGGNGPGNGNNQLNAPMTVAVDKQNNSLIIGDTRNKRVVRWSRQKYALGETIISNIDCCGLVMHNDGSLYVTDRKKNEVRRYKIGNPTGTVVAGGNQPPLE